MLNSLNLVHAINSNSKVIAECSTLYTGAQAHAGGTKAHPHARIDDYYEDIHNFFKYEPANVARKLYAKGFIDGDLNRRVTNVQTVMSNASKADELWEAVKEFINGHSHPAKMMESLLEVIDRCGPIGHNVAEKIRKVSELCSLK